MAYEFYMTVKGKSSGDIKGSCQQTQFKDQILCYGLKHEMFRPTNPNDGIPVGNRRHGPFTVTKEFDAATPVLNKAWAHGESLDVETKWVRINAAGQKEHYFTIALTDATIVKVEPVTHMTLDERYRDYAHMEEVSFVYRKIRWVWVPTGVESSDDWLEA